MAPDNDVCSQTDVTTATKMQRLTTTMETLPFDLIPEILCRLPVKLLLQLKCVCKYWNSLISDPKFAKKHLRVSNTYHHRHHVIVKGSNTVLWDCTISSIFSDASTTLAVPQLELIRPNAINNTYNKYLKGRCFSSCDGILLFAINTHSPLLWNPSIRKFKILPSLLYFKYSLKYTFGYDHFIDNYKVFAITTFTPDVIVNVYTLGSDSWRRIGDFPYGSIRESGMFVSGSVNWLQRDTHLGYPYVIVSLDLEKESYRRFLLPDLNDLEEVYSTLGVLRDCLCIFALEVEFFDVWVMKEYGIEDSWTKLFSVPYMGGPDSFYTKVLYVFEDDQVLLDYRDPQLDLKLVVYKSKNGIFKIPKIQNMYDWMSPDVYVESLISPCS